MSETDVFNFMETFFAEAAAAHHHSFKSGGGGRIKGGGDLSFRNLVTHQLDLVPDWSFRCSGVIFRDL